MRGAYVCHVGRRDWCAGMVLAAALVLSALLCCSSGAWAQATGVQIRAPQPDPAKPTELPEVRGLYPLSATKQNPEEGWVSIVLTGGPGITEPQFLAAVIAPYKYNWDTRARVGGKRVYPDGDYTLQFSAHKPTGESLGKQTITARVANDVAPPEVAEGIELRHQYAARERARCKVKCESRLLLPTQLRPLEILLGSMQAELDLGYTSVVMDVDELAEFPGIFEATIRNTPYEGVLTAQGQAPRLFPGLGRSQTVRARTNGLIRPVRPQGERFAFGEMYIVLPSGPVRLGHRWTGEAAVMPEFNTVQRQIVPAQHVLEGFEWLQGQKCARIRSTYRYPGYVTIVVEGAGLDVQTTMQGERATYFAYETGKVLLIEETNQHRLQINLEEVGKRPEAEEGEEDGEEEEEEEEEASAGRPWYVEWFAEPSLWPGRATMVRDEGCLLPASLTDGPQTGTLYFAQRPTFGRPTVGPPAGPTRPAAGRPAPEAPAAAAEGGLVVDVPYEVRIRIERSEATPTT